MLFFFDLDGLKQINDRLGHEAGSASIRRFAGTLVTTFRKTDIVARLGGDEFVVLAATTQESAEELLKRLGKNVNLSNALDSAASEVAYSAGYVEVANPAATTINDLVAQADALMYEQKQRKKRESAPGAPKIATDQAAA
jgi:diguanylate cyclase (GGDEF)-like protein